MERGISKSAQLESLIAKRDIQGLWRIIETLDEFPLAPTEIKTIELYHLDLLVKAMFSLLHEKTHEKIIRKALVQSLGRKRGSKTFSSAKDYRGQMQKYSQLMVYELHKVIEKNKRGEIKDAAVTLFQTTDLIHTKKPDCIGDSPDDTFNIPFPSLDYFFETSLALLHIPPVELYPYGMNPSTIVYLFPWDSYDKLRGVLSQAKERSHKNDAK